MLQASLQNLILVDQRGTAGLRTNCPLAHYQVTASDARMDQPIDKVADHGNQPRQGLFTLLKG